jgi:cation:H+ antiporter
MLIPLLALLIGLLLLVWSSDRFVDGAAGLARHFGMPPLLIGMVVIGFGTSMPEMVVSALSSVQGNPGLALGNAYGSNIVNIALILGLTALIHPIAVHSQVLRKELPILGAVTLLAAFQALDLRISRTEGVVLLGVFAALMVWTSLQALRQRGDALAQDIVQELSAPPPPLSRSLVWLVIGLLLLIASSQLLVWGAVKIAYHFGVSDLIVGLTIVAVGTSLPELASSIAASRKGESDLALGNIIGSNLFNTLAVVGIAGSIQPMAVDRSVLTRDLPVMGALTVALFFLCLGWRGQAPRIGRLAGALLLAAYVAYDAYLIWQVTSA